MVRVVRGANIGTAFSSQLFAFDLGPYAVVALLPGLLLVGQFTALVLRLAGNADVARQIAHAHVLFNVAGVLVFAPLVPLCQRLLDAWLPDGEPAQARRTAAPHAA